MNFGPVAKERVAKWRNCPLCMRSLESIAHLLTHCRYTHKLWSLIKEWLGLFFINLNSWHALSLHEWWTVMTGPSTPNRKGIASIVALTSWQIWNERNARVFRHKHMPPSVLCENIKKELELWVAAGAKGVSILMLRE
jgi:hypothetical protein